MTRIAILAYDVYSRCLRACNINQSKRCILKPPFSNIVMVRKLLFYDDFSTLFPKQKKKTFGKRTIKPNFFFSQKGVLQLPRLTHVERSFKLTTLANNVISFKHREKRVNNEKSTHIQTISTWFSNSSHDPFGEQTNKSLLYLNSAKRFRGSAMAQVTRLLMLLMLDVAWLSDNKYRRFFPPFYLSKILTGCVGLILWAFKLTNKINKRYIP